MTKNEPETQSTPPSLAGGAIAPRERVVRGHAAEQGVPSGNQRRGEAANRRVALALHGHDGGSDDGPPRMVAQRGDECRDRTVVDLGVGVGDDDLVRLAGEGRHAPVDTCTKAQVLARHDDPHLSRELAKCLRSRPGVAVLDHDDLRDSLGLQRGDAPMQHRPDVVIDDHRSRSRADVRRHR